MSEIPQQGEFDLGVEPKPKRLEGEALEAERERIVDGVRRATAQKNGQELGKGGFMQDRLKSLGAADLEINAGVSAARADQTSEVLLDHEVTADIRAAQDKVEEAARQRRIVARQLIKDVQAAEQREINKLGMEEVARYWTPPETQRQQALREAVEKGEAARANQARDMAEQLSAEEEELEEPA